MPELSSGSIIVPGAGADSIYIEPDSVRHSTTQGSIYHIDDPDGADRVFWNGYLLSGGEQQWISGHAFADYDNPHPDLAIRGAFIGGLGEVYQLRGEDDGSATLFVCLPDNSVLELSGWSPGDAGLVLAEHGWKESAIVDQRWSEIEHPYHADSLLWIFGNTFDAMDDLPGRYAAFTYSGPAIPPALPPEPVF